MIITPLSVAPSTFEVRAPFIGALITPEIPVNAPTRALWCDNCGDFREHTLERVTDMKYYMCDCGTGIMYIIVRSENR